jgi:hypothetical protein
VLGVLEVLHDQPEVFVDPLDWAIEIAFAVAMGLAAAALLLLGRRATGLVRVAWGTAAAGAAAVAAAAGATAVAGEEVWGALLGVGLVCVLLGYLAALVLDLRGRVQPRRAAVVLFVALIASVVAESTGAGGVVLAAGWLAVAKLSADRQPARAA